MPDALRTWQEGTNKLARDTSSRVAATYLKYADGTITRDETIGIQATLIATAQRRAATFNDVLLAAELSERLEGQYTAVGIDWSETPQKQAARLGTALDTVLRADVGYVAAAKTREQAKQLEAQSVRARLNRLTDTEITEASQWSRQTAMQVWEEQGVIVGWYRRIRPDACDFCRTMGGKPNPERFVHPVSHRMGTHPFCHCSQGWVTEVEPWQKWVGPREQMKYVTPPATPAPAWPKRSQPVPGNEMEHVARVLPTLQRMNPAQLQRRLTAAEKTEKAMLKKAQEFYQTQIAAGKTQKEIMQMPRYKTLEKQWKQQRLKVKQLTNDLRESTGAVTATNAYEQLLRDAAAIWDTYEELPITTTARELLTGTNPTWAPNADTAVNCTRVAAAYEMRRRGLAVVAREAGPELGWTKTSSQRMWRTAAGDEPVETVLRPGDTFDVQQFLDAAAGWPPGARGYVSCGWRSGGGHIFNIEKLPDGELVFHEAQPDATDRTRTTPVNSPEGKELVGRMSRRAALLRLDDLVPTLDLAAYLAPA